MTLRHRSDDQKYQASKPQRNSGTGRPVSMPRRHPVLELQSSVGNAQIARMLAEDERSASEPESNPGVGGADPGIADAVVQRSWLSSIRGKLEESGYAADRTAGQAPESTGERVGLSGSGGALFDKYGEIRGETQDASHDTWLNLEDR